MHYFVKLNADSRLSSISFWSGGQVKFLTWILCFCNTYFLLPMIPSMQFCMLYWP